MLHPRRQLAGTEPAEKAGTILDVGVNQNPGNPGFSGNPAHDIRRKRSGTFRIGVGNRHYMWR
jgi:hypothetical protein